MIITEQESQSLTYFTKNYGKKGMFSVQPRDMYVGGFYAMEYDPKYKVELPYYDKLPLVFVFNMGPDYFYGINFHYLPFRERIMVLKVVNYIADRLKFKSRSSNLWNLLQASVTRKFVEVSSKKYLYSHIKQVKEVEKQKWKYLVTLPVVGFEKATTTEVWKESIEKANNDEFRNRQQRLENKLLRKNKKNK